VIQNTWKKVNDSDPVGQVKMQCRDVIRARNTVRIVVKVEFLVPALIGGTGFNKVLGPSLTTGCVYRTKSSACSIQDRHVRGRERFQQ